MSPCHPALLDNLRYLDQAADLLEVLTPEDFVHTHPPLYTSGIGPHLRHCMDHYELFTQGLSAGKVDYDLRPRRDLQQRDPEAMRRWIQEIREALLALGEADPQQEILVKMDGGSKMKNPWSRSSVLREFQFLISHTVHHFALIAMILKDQGHPVPSEFGVAPSTLRHLAEQAACAQ